MTARTAGNNGRRPAWWSKLLRSVGATTGVIAAATTVAVAQDAGYRSAASAPVTWNAFARELQERFQQQLDADDRDAGPLRDAIARHQKQSPEILVARTWISSKGVVERLEFSGLDLDDDTLAVALRARLASVVVSPPPSDMLQPLHLRLSLRASEPSGKER